LTKIDPRSIFVDRSIDQFHFYHFYQKGEERQRSFFLVLVWGLVQKEGSSLKNIFLLFKVLYPKRKL